MLAVVTDDDQDYFCNSDNVSTKKKRFNKKTSG